MKPSQWGWAPVLIALAFVVLIGALAKRPKIASIRQETMDKAIEANVKVADWLLRFNLARDIEGTLNVIAAQISTAIKIDTITTLARVDVRGSVMSYIYSIERELLLPDDFIQKLTGRYCNQFRSYVDSGVTVKAVYLSSASCDIGEITADRAACGAI